MVILLSQSSLPLPSGGDQTLLVQERDLQDHLRECLTNALRVREERERLCWNVQAQELQNQLQLVWDRLQAQAREYVELRRPAVFTMKDTWERLASELSNS